ncbi:hypothetical protein AM588_10001857 [Phytophthora nicotianae]|uniref:Uncharacterized protein n=1 Tax=Phytophthora nicotianae TaxID=4792 RepID=A0A0W8CS11_PHYNI|nr:hypothetical protein AM588_10001857 [Phytophthora nicotianae]
MTSTGSKVRVNQPTSEGNDPLETYEFVPDHLRHHFKADLEAFLNEESDREERELVRHARQARSAHLVANSLSQQPRPASTQLLYSNAIERAITARMTYSRALEGLEKYFNDVMAKVKHLEIQHPSSGFDSSGLKIPTLMQTQRQIINVCQGCLNDCDLYLGMYEALPSPPATVPTPIVRYVACSTKSSMLHQRLECPFQASEGQQHPQSADNQSRSMCITMQAMVAKEAIIVDDIADLEPSEIHRFSLNQTSTGSFSCFPLLTSETGTSTAVIGVLSVDSCRKAHRLLPQSMSVETLGLVKTGVRHDWVNLVVWLDNPALVKPAMLATSASTYGNLYVISKPPKTSDVINGTTPKLRYDEDGYEAWHTVFQFHEEGEYQDLIQWNQLTDAAREALTNTDFGVFGHVPFIDAFFETNLKEASTYNLYNRRHRHGGASIWE